MTTEVIKYRGAYLLVEFEYSPPDRGVGWGGAVMVEHVYLETDSGNTDLIELINIAQLEDFIFELKTHPFI